MCIITNKQLFIAIRIFNQPIAGVKVISVQNQNYLIDYFFSIATATIKQTLFRCGQKIMVQNPKMDNFTTSPVKTV